MQYGQVGSAEHKQVEVDTSVVVELYKQEAIRTAKAVDSRVLGSSIPQQKSRLKLSTKAIMFFSSLSPFPLVMVNSLSLYLSSRILLVKIYF